MNKYSYIKKILPNILLYKYKNYKMSRSLVKSNEIILVFQMGRVGSTSIMRTLKNVQSPPVFKIHFLSSHGIQNTNQYFSENRINRRLRGEHIVLPAEIERSYNSKQWKIISLVRDPISREISDFIKNVHSYFPALIEANGKLNIKKSIDHLTNEFKLFDEVTDYACTWFDKEMKAVFNVDIFEYPFDQSSGYIIIQKNNVELLLMTLEELNNCFETAINDFLGIKEIEMIKANTAAAGNYAIEYEQIKNNLKIPKSICKKIYSSRFAKYFYSEKIRIDLITKWSVT